MNSLIFWGVTTKHFISVALMINAITVKKLMIQYLVGTYKHKMINDTFIYLNLSLHYKAIKTFKMKCQKALESV